MSINAAFADGVPAAPDELVSGERSAPSGPGAPAGSPDDDLERWYAVQRRWPAFSDPQGRLWLEAGTEFDVIDVPEGAGRQALGRLIGYGQAALTPGPVALAEPERCLFFVAPGARDDLPELLDWLDWGGIDLGMRALGAGDRLPAPARDRWLHDPLAVPPEVIALLATIAESCSRYALTRRTG